MSATTVAQRKRTKGWRKPPNSVCVDRTSRWGNPAVMQQMPHGWRVIVPGTELTEFFDTRAEAARFAVDLFVWWVATSDDPRAVSIRKFVYQLKGKTLLCYCDGPPCHAYALAEMADAA